MASLRSEPAAVENLAEQEPSTPPSAPAPRLQWARPICVGLPLIVLNCGWIAYSEMRTGVTEITISTLFMGVTFILFVVTLANLLVRRLFGPRAAMSQPELMALYTILSLSSVVAGVGHFGFFTPFLVGPFYYATHSNGWQGFWYLLPAYIGPRDPSIIHGFFVGHSTFFQAKVMAAWAMPLAAWCGFFLILIWTLLCVSAIVRRRWADEEHLSFPVLAVPLEITREGAPLYRNRLMWLGFLLPTLLHSLNSLQTLMPTLPYWHINSARNLVADSHLPYPWNGMGSFIYLLHFSGVGFGYLINTEVTFSLWFFYLVKKALEIWGTAENWRDPAIDFHADGNGQFPFINFQGCGAWLALGLLTLWTGRTYYKAYLLRALRGTRDEADNLEPMSARIAIVGLLAGFVALCTFVWSAGGSWWLPVAFLGAYFLIMVSLTRIRAEAAVVCTPLLWVSPQDCLINAFGPAAFSRIDLAHIASLSWFNLDYRATAMPHLLEAFVGMRRARGRLSPLVPIILLAAAVAMVAALLWDLQLYYTLGAATAKVNGWRIQMGTQPWNLLQHWLKNPRPPNGAGIAGMALGVAMTLALTALRARFVGFPLHPAGYVLNVSFANDYFWCDMLVAWLVKTLILRYGGIKLYQSAMPLFLGFILGDFVSGSAWSIVGTVFHLSLFRTFAN
ncbi:MAG TPA: DUF6785 family protein [Capsulimonadaceae bacterium]|nr:DUF6785 family protein [Capsulimonadaceae bacterium]